MVTIEESGMIFGEFDEKNIFQIENSVQYKKHLLHDGVKTCEFILKQDQKLIFLEAKTSCPNYFNADSTTEMKQKYEAYINDIVGKMRDSLMLYANILLKRYPQDDIPEGLREKDLSDMELVLVLVVKTAEPRWLAPFTEIFRRALHKEMKIWKIRSFLVINEDTAKRKKLIS